VNVKIDGGRAARSSAGRAGRRARGAWSLAVCGLALVAMAVLGTGTAGAQDGDAPPPDEATPEVTPAAEEAPPADDAAEADEDESSIITITQQPLQVGGLCNPAAQASLTYTTKSDAEVFQLVITSHTNPCSPIHAAAVAYAMPPGASPAGGQWPQTLLERKDFTISQASITTVTFDKECAAIQFDVITGESPQTISPTGPWHGPLLFVGDTSTSEQYFPPTEQCGGGTTTTTSTTQPSVAGVTTVPQVATNVVSPGAAVADVSATRGPEGAALALTGSASGGLALLGGALLLAGAAMYLTSRRVRQD
jgi:hypothetical protein